jgi:hypothetical protein
MNTVNRPQPIENCDSLDDELFFAAFEWEREWRKSLKKLTDRELIEIFQPAREMLREKITEWWHRRDTIVQEINLDWRRIPEEHAWFHKILFEKLRMPELREIDQHIARLKRQILMLTSPIDRPGRHWQSMSELIAKARTYPIYEFARDKLNLKPSGVNFVALCPFHDERTPSFYLYTGSNRFCCFGCGEKGDVINLTMRLHGVGFADAVKMLQ